MKKFFNGLLVIVLILVIVGGLGYIGYSYYSMNSNGMNMAANTGNNPAETKPADNSMNMQSGSSMDMNNMQNNSMNNQNTVQQANFALQNKEAIDKAESLLDEIIKTMSMDPYASSGGQPQAGNMQTSSPVNPQSQTGNIQTNGAVNPQPQTGNGQANSGTNTQGNTTVNIYPSAVPSTVMPSPNTPVVTNATQSSIITAYDQAKMEQFHNGLYKISMGKQLLSQLQDDFMAQAQTVGADIKDPVQYYINQYSMAVQSKNQLSRAISYIDEASSLVNINPYISSNGFVYDKDKMQQIHGSVLKLAQSVGALNKLNSDMTKQAITFANQAQNYANIAQNNMTQNNMAGMGNSTGLFSNISMSSVVNILLIIFISAFVIGMLGFVLSLLKPSAAKVNKSV